MKTFCVIDYFVKQDVRSLNRLKLYIGNSTCLKTRQTVHNIHIPLLCIWCKCKWCFAYLSFIWKRVLKTNLIKKKKKKNLPHLQLKKKKKLGPLGTENKKNFPCQAGGKKTCPDPNFLLPPPLKSNGASLIGVRVFRDFHFSWMFEEFDMGYWPNVSFDIEMN